MQSGILTYKNSTLHFLRLGTGSKLLLAFHGFDNDATLFLPLVKHIEEDYTVVSIDLPGHGKTDWQQKYLSKQAFITFVERLKLEFNVEKFSLIGFSLGGRFALNIIEQRSEWVDKLFLLASDGLSKNFWYNFATRNLLGKVLFKKMVENPKKTVDILHFLKRFKMVNSSTLRYVQVFLRDEAFRQQLNFVWPVTSRLIPEPGKVRWNIKKHKIPTHIYLGKGDKLFSVKAAEKFTKGLPSTHLHVINTGHSLMSEKLALEVADLLKS